MTRTGLPSAGRMWQPNRVPVVFAGLATLDVVQRVDHLPAANEKVTSVAESVASGGPAANAAKTFAVLGGRARLITALGAGPLASVVRSDLEAFGVEVIDVAPETFRDPPVASITVLQATGERAVVAPQPGPLGALGEVARWLDDAECLLVDGHHAPLALAAARAARDRGIEVVVDAGRAKPVFAELLPLCRTAICSADFRWGGADDVAGTARVLLGLGLHRVAFTAGAGPIVWWSVNPNGGESRHGEVAPTTVRAVDTLGAGDVLHGAYCHARTRRRASFADHLDAAADLASRRTAHVGLNAWLAAERTSVAGRARWVD